MKSDLPKMQELCEPQPFAHKSDLQCQGIHQVRMSIPGVRQATECVHFAVRSTFRHFLSECTHLPEEDRRYMAKVRQVINLLDDEDEQNSPEPEVSNTEVVDSERPIVQKIEVRQCPYLDVFCRHHTTRVTIDSGATGNMIRHSTAHKLGFVKEKSSQSAHQADGSSPLSIVGETSISHDNNTFTFNGLVVENLDVEIFAGTPFMETNDITICPAKHLIILSSGTTYTY